MKNLKVFAITLALILTASFSFAQTQTLSSTTLGAAIGTLTNGVPQTTITLASTSTMLNAGPQAQVNTVLYVDKELMFVSTVVDSTHVIVKRAQGTGEGAILTTHLNGAAVLFAITNAAGTNNVTAAPAFFSNKQPTAQLFGSCVSTSLLVQPLVYPFSGDIFSCLGVTGSQQWVQVDRPGRPTVAATAAAPTGLLTITATNMVLSGTNAITGVNVPAGWASGMSFTIMPTGIFTWTTATNLAVAGTAVVGKALTFTWNATTSKWYPSYIA